jgi:hypothetical protein
MKIAVAFLKKMKIAVGIYPINPIKKIFVGLFCIYFNISRRNPSICIQIFFWFTSNILVCFLSNQPKRTLTSKYLITLLYYGGVKAEYFIELLHDAIERVENARYGYNDALKRKF